jgi:hypothetical protein
MCLKSFPLFLYSHTASNPPFTTYAGEGGRERGEE